MKKSVFILLLLLPVVAFTQVDIKREIMAYVDSSEVLIKNGRKLMIENLTFGNIDDAKNVLNYLKNNTSSEYIILYPSEEILFSLASRSFQLFLYNAENYNSLLEGKTKQIYYEDITMDLHSYLSSDMDFIKQDLQEASLSDKDREFINLYIDYYNREEINTLNQRIKQYQKKYPKNEYSDFLKIIKTQTAQGSMNFNFGFGNTFVSGPITDYYDKNSFGTFWMEMDAFINKFYTSLYLGVSMPNMKSTQDIKVRNKNLTHLSGEDVSSLKFGLKAGHVVYSGKNLRVYPYASIGGYEMITQWDVLDPEDEDDARYRLSSAFMAGAGISADITLFRWNLDEYYAPFGNIFIRPNFGFDKFIGKKDNTKGQAFYISIAIGIALGS